MQAALEEQRAQLAQLQNGFRTLEAELQKWWQAPKQQQQQHDDPEDCYVRKDTVLDIIRQAVEENQQKTQALLLEQQQQQQESRAREMVHVTTEEDPKATALLLEQLTAKAKSSNDSQSLDPQSLLDLMRLAVKEQVKEQTSQWQLAHMIQEDARRHDLDERHRQVQADLAAQVDALDTSPRGTGHAAAKPGGGAAGKGANVGAGARRRAGGPVPARRTRRKDGRLLDQGGGGLQVQGSAARSRFAPPRTATTKSSWTAWSKPGTSSLPISCSLWNRGRPNKPRRASSSRKPSKPAARRTTSCACMSTPSRPRGRRR